MNETLKKELKKLLGAKDDGFGVSRTSEPKGWRRKLEGAGWVEDFNARKSICDGFGLICTFARGEDRITVLTVHTAGQKNFEVRAIRA